MKNQPKYKTYNGLSYVFLHSLDGSSINLEHKTNHLIAETEPAANQDTTDLVARRLYTGKCVVSCASTVQKESAMGDITVTSNAVHDSRTHSDAQIFAAHVYALTRARIQR